MTLPAIAVVGGTGNLGAAIAWRLARAGYPVTIGSRNAESAEKAAAELGHGLRAGANVDVVANADIIIVTVPFGAQEATLRDIAPHVVGKLVVDTTVPLVPPKVMRVQLPDEGSAAQKAQAVLGEGVTLVSAFHNVAAHKLAKDIDVGCDVLVFGDDKDARSRIVALADAMGLRGLHGGALVNSAAAEALTSILIFMNKTYKVDGAGIRITGDLIPPEA
ncbi:MULTISPECIES: NADPH-dependent F420 reductase [Sphingobium]|uniref:NADPH-dependent F420 reductase n=1 Tax=Sphingobium fuliginis ATCC 27551 TaxID=1208342 RepID=A0A5B8CFW5_SPHSA|nr:MULTISPECIES: NADPH-dependent F420 reductase [Sphingobium]OAP33655.1 NADPH-dependent F420 reductase [Sphingobium sp. 20006FA]AJR25423.1 F420-dependent NADP reductase [Sphingobium sp. YBL2]KXU33589.1 NADPH-dependent F420 reductase [Sphingobium sp. AM]KYC34044.1 NADPH-dependent F420 reductase [Sphingobium sp. 22B]QDC36980.1 NADPH-dependent F420 reductase [Sphingobium fuliginis ATCC 27551]